MLQTDFQTLADNILSQAGPLIFKDSQSVSKLANHVRMATRLK